MWLPLPASGGATPLCAVLTCWSREWPPENVISVGSVCVDRSTDASDRKSDLVTDPVIVRWLWSPADERSHVLDEDSAGFELAVTRCGQELPGIVTLYSIAPSMTICPQCGVYAAVPLPEHGTQSDSMSL